MTEAQRLKNMEIPNGKVDMVLDTDAFNEIDDQFAIAYTLRSSDKCHLREIYAAPFLNKKVSSAEEGMEASYHEILKILDLAGCGDMKEKTYRGSARFMTREDEPVDSPAARALIELSKEYTAENPLYVVALGAITNVSSALVMDPTLKERITVVWLGGHSIHFAHNKEFNLRQDVAGARVLFGCGVPLVILPCAEVVRAFTLSGPELEYWLAGKNPLADYLAKNTIREAESYAKGTAWTRPIWDVTAVAWLLNDKDRFMTSYLIPAPIPEYDHHYAFDYTRHMIRYVNWIHRDALMTDMLTKLAK